MTHYSTNVLFVALNPNHLSWLVNGLQSVNRYYAPKGDSFSELVLFADSSWKNPRQIRNKALQVMLHDYISPGDEGKQLFAFKDAKVTLIYDDHFLSNSAFRKKKLILAVEQQMHIRSNKNESVYLHLDCGTSTQGVTLLLNGLRHCSKCLYRMVNAKHGVASIHDYGDLNEVDPLHLNTLLEHTVGNAYTKDLTTWKSNGTLTRALINRVDELVTENETLRLLSYSERCKSVKDEFDAKWDDFKATEALVKKNLETIFNVPRNEILFRPKIETRPKTFPSFWKKLIDKEIKDGIQNDPFKRITDCIGAKVVFFNLSDYKAGCVLLSKSDLFIGLKSKRLKGDNKYKEFEYEATHFDVKFNPKFLSIYEQELKEYPAEIQLKTIVGDSMNFVHHELVYKDFNRPQKLSERQKEEMIEAFRNAGEALDTADKKIDEICTQFDPRNVSGGRKR
jgi:ppGpp synthetase/RelA/SpoT-type nucleotidyltranferase